MKSLIGKTQEGFKTQAKIRSVGLTIYINLNLKFNKIKKKLKDEY